MKKIILIISIFMLSSCQIINLISPKSTEIKMESEKPKIIEAEGTIKAKQLSRFEEGTHLLVNKQGVKIYIIKSKIENLSSFEGKTVHVKGEIDNNQVLNVLNIEEIKKEEDVPRDISKTLYLREKGMKITIPSDWTEKKDQEDKWLLAPLGLEQEVITIDSFSSNSEKGQNAKKDIEDAIDIVIAKKEAFRLTDGKKVNIFVFRKNDIVNFYFNSQEDEISEKLVFLNMLSTLEWSYEVEEATPLEDLEKCGGRGNKLCPVGFRCELQSAENNAEGVCRDVNSAVIIEKDEEIAPETEEIAPIIDKNDEAIINTEEVSLETNTEREIKAPKSELTEIEIGLFSYKVSAPKNYYWRHFGRQGEALSLVALSDIDMEDVSDAVITIKILKEEKSASSYEKEDNFTIIKTRDSESHFEISGNKQYQSVLEQIANSITTF